MALPEVSYYQPVTPLRSIDLLHEAFRAVTIVETDDIRPTNTHLHNASREVGGLIVKAVQHRSFRASPCKSQRARAELKAQPTPNLDIQAQCLLLGHTLTVVNNRQSEKGTRAALRGLQEATIILLGQASDRVKMTQNPDNLGLVAELAFLALINRDGTPHALALPALPHHDESSIQCGNYDGVLSVVRDLGLDPETRFIQTKSAEVGSGRFRRLSEKYVSSISMLSGQTDMQLNDPATSQRLIDEHWGEANVFETRALDELADLVIVEAFNPSRFGRLELV